jgi:PAS domain S-box-containing protein
MRQLDRMLGSVLEAAPDAMICVQANGDIALVNVQAVQLFGYQREELVGRRLETLVPEPFRGVHRRYRAGYVAHPKPRAMGGGLELAGRRRDGTTFPAEISLSAIDTGEGLLTIAAVRDVTERLAARAEHERLRSQVERDKLERQLQQSQRLESLGQLAGGVAHDFNNLLGVISNYAAFIAEEVAQSGPQVRLEEIREDIEQIERAADRAGGLTRQLLAFARREVVQPRVLNLNEVMADLKHLLIRTLGEHVELSTSLCEGLSPVLADPCQIEQVLVNLAVNARDAMPGGGRLTIETSRSDVDEASVAVQAGLCPGTYVALKVSDTGIGMPNEMIDRAFEPFFTTKPKGEGTGLGLATVYGIVQQAGGTVRIYSEPGLGTTVTVLLPVTDQPLPAAGPPPRKAQDGRGEVVLVVEDEAAVREVARRILDRNGYHVLAVEDGPQAIDVARSSGRIDLLLTDVVMPRMLGKDVADQIRVAQPGIRVLFMSGYTQGLLGAQGVLGPGVNLIEKPFSEQALLTKLGEVLAGPS